MASRRLQVVLDLDTGRYTGRMTQAAAVTRSFSGVANSSSSSVRQLGASFDNLNNRMSTPLSKLRDYVLILGNIRLAIINVRDIAVGWVGAMMMQSAQVERLTMLMKGLSNAQTEVGKNQEAQKNLQFLFQEARRTGFAIDALADSFVKFKSGGLDPMAGGMIALDNAVARFGGNSDVMHRASIAIQQMAGKGVVSMEELRQQLGEAVPTAMADMARAAGMALPEFTKLVSKGVVQAKPALELMFREFDLLYAGAGERMASTFTGQLAQFKTNVMQMSTDFTGMSGGVEQKGGLFDILKTQLQEINAAMRTSEFRGFMLEFGQAVGTVVGWLVKCAKAIIEWRDLIGGALKVAITGFLALKAAATLNWLAQSILGLGAAATRAFASVGTLSTMGLQVSSTAGTAATATAGWASAVDQAANRLKNLVALQQTAAVQARQGVISAQNSGAAARARALATQAEVVALEQKVAAERLNIQAARQAQTQAQANIATGVRTSASVQQLTKAKSAETMANLRLSQAERDLAVARRAAAVAAAQSSAATNAETAAASRQIVAANGATIALRVKAAAMTAAAFAARGLAVAVNLVLGPLGMIALALYSAASAAGVFENKADKAAAAAARLMAGIADLDAMKDVSSRKEANRRDIEAGEQAMKSSGMLNADGSLKAGANINQIRLWNRTQRLKRENQEHDAALKRGSVSMEAEGAQNLGGLASDISDKKLEKSRARYQRLKNNPNSTQAQLTAAGDAFEKEQRRVYTQTIGNLEARARAAEDKGNDQQARIIRKSIEAYKEKIGWTDAAYRSNEQLREGLVGTAKDAAKSGDAQEAAAKKAATAYENARDKYATMIGNQLGDIAELNAQMGGAEGSLAEFQARVKAGLFPDALPEEIKALEDGFRKIEQLTNEVEFGKSLRQLRKEVVQTTADANNMWAALMADNTGKRFEDYERSEQVKAKYADKIAAAEKTGDPAKIAEVNAEIEKLIANLDRIDAATAMNNWRIMADEIQISLLSEEQQREANFQNELRRQQHMLDVIRRNADISAADKMAAEERFTRWRQLSQIKLARENESSVTKMARDWAKLGQNIDQALAGALNNFVDGMMEADFNFGKFALSIVKELIKIILRAMIAYAILSAIGMTPTGADGKKMSMGQFMKSEIKTGFSGGAGGFDGTGNGNSKKPNFNPPFPGGGTIDERPTTFDPKGTPFYVPTAHIGGVIGRLRQSTMVDPSVFAAAKTYHTGTNSIGGRALRPGEVPMIGMEGEAVLTAEQQAAVRRGLMAAGNPAPVVVNFINNSNTPLSAETSEPEFNGREMVVSIIVEEMQKEGPLRNAMGAMK